MSKYKCHLLIVSLCIISLIKEGVTFKCYKCTSQGAQGCKDPFNVTQLVLTEDCNYDYQVCVKQEIMSPYRKYFNIQALFMHTTFPDLVEDEIKRGCMHEDYCYVEGMRSTHCSTCKSYLCNSAISLSFLSLPILFLYQFALHLIKC
uniref:Protein sleepless n=1 Tax=Photinus pyralis TaxID=7054 RepID=A0A1Y1LMI5_PHOPY